MTCFDIGKNCDSQSSSFCSSPPCLLDQSQSDLRFLDPTSLAFSYISNQVAPANPQAVQVGREDRVETVCLCMTDTHTHKIQRPIQPTRRNLWPYATALVSLWVIPLDSLHSDEILCCCGCWVLSVGSGGRSVQLSSCGYFEKLTLQWLRYSP